MSGIVPGIHSISNEVPKMLIAYYMKREALP